MKKIILLVLIFWSSQFITSADTPMDTIDTEFATCTQNKEWLVCMETATSSWEIRLNTEYKNIMNSTIIGKSQKEILKKSQRAWLVYRNNEIRFLEKFYGNTTTGNAHTMKNRKMNITRSRSLELEEYGKYIDFLKSERGL